MKKARQNKIIEIIGRYEISTQETLKKRLEEEGIAVTQATLSRDINELCLKKKLSPSGTYIYTVEPKARVKYPPIFRDAVISVDYALNTAVIKCHAGMAQAACAALDRLNFPETVGTIAGDDTIFVLMRSEAAAGSFAKQLQGFVDGK